MVTQEQYNVLQQPTRYLNIKIELLNDKDVTVGSFDGVALDGNVSLSGESTYRRSGNLKMLFDKKYNMLPSPSSKIWFNRRIRIWIGLKDYFDKIQWFDIGKFAIDEVELDINTSEKTISCQLKDYMAFLDGTLGGNLSHRTLIEGGSTTINDAIKTTIGSLSRFSIDNIEVNGSLATIPYDIDKPPNSTIYELLKELINLYKDYDMYFDNEGYFRVEKIKNRENDVIIWDFEDDRKKLSINFNSKIDFKNVKNSIWIWGRQLETGDQVKWNYRNRFSRNTINQMNAISDRQVNDICHVISENKSYYWNGVQWELLDFKVIPIFNIESIDEKIWSYSDDKIFDNNQAKIRSEYHLKEYSNFAERINFSCVPIYILDINKKIRLNIENSIVGDYLIQSINIPLNINNAMTVEASKIYY